MLARTGVGSRRVCEDLIVDGRVTVNGEVPVLGRRVDPEVDVIELDGVPLPVRPGSCTTWSTSRPGWCPRPRTPTAGPPWWRSSPPSPGSSRSAGWTSTPRACIIVTNDGELTHRLTHPSYGVPKEYLVQVEGEPSPGPCGALREGVELEDGRTAPARVAVVAPGLLRMVIHEGRNRQVRRMCEAVGHPVVRLVAARQPQVAELGHAES